MGRRQVDEAVGIEVLARERACPGRAAGRLVGAKTSRLRSRRARTRRFRSRRHRTTRPRSGHRRRRTSRGSRSGAPEERGTSRRPGRRRRRRRVRRLGRRGDRGCRRCRDRRLPGPRAMRTLVVPWRTSVASLPVKIASSLPPATTRSSLPSLSKSPTAIDLGAAPAPTLSGLSKLPSRRPGRTVRIGAEAFARTTSGFPSCVASVTTTEIGVLASGISAGRPKTAAEASGTKSSPAVRAAAPTDLTLI